MAYIVSLPHRIATQNLLTKHIISDNLYADVLNPNKHNQEVVMEAKNFDECKTMKDVLSLLEKETKITANQMTFTEKLSELLLRPDQIEFNGEVQKIFHQTFPYIGTENNVRITESENKARDLAIKLTQIQNRRWLVQLDKSKGPRKHNYSR